MSDAAKKSGFLTTALAAVGGFLIFSLILLIAYFPNRAQPIPQGTKTDQERANILSELRAHETDFSSSYGWVDQSKGIVRVPIERAMQLTLDDLNRPAK